MVKLAYNANGLRNMDVISAIHEVKKYNYDGIELSLHKAHLHPFDVTEEKLTEIKQALEKEALPVACLATGAADLLTDEDYEPSLITNDEEGRKVRIQCIKKSIEIAKFLGIDKVNISSGFKKAEVGIEEAMDKLVAGIKECIEVCGDITLALEPEPGMFVETTEQGIEVIKRVNSEKLKLNTDIGHVVCCEEDYLEKIRNACKYSAHFHIEDIKNRIHYHEIPGEGDIDLKAVLDILKEENYDGYVSVELYHHVDVYEKALKESHDYLRPLM